MGLASQSRRDDSVPLHSRLSKKISPTPLPNEPPRNATESKKMVAKIN